MSIVVKWTLAIGALISLVMLTLGWVLLTQQHHLHSEEFEEFGRVLVKQLAYSASEPLLAEDEIILQGLVTRQTTNRDIVGAAIINAKGHREATGLLPKSLPKPANPVSIRWTWTDDQHRPHSFISFVSPILFKDLLVGQAVITIDRSVLQRHQRRTVQLIVLATFGLLLISAVLSYILSKNLSHPITALAQATFGQGPLQLGNRGKRKDEIGQVYTHFERLSAGLVEKHHVEAALARYVSPVVAAKIMSNFPSLRLPNQEIYATVLFCDIVGFTRLSEDLPPDEVAALLNRYLGAIADAAHRCSGYVDKFIGDSAMILFGVTEDNPSHAQQAVRCAGLIHGLVHHINRQRRLERKDPIHLRIGINSGTMLAGNIGTPDRMEYTVVGDTVNLASRLCGLAPSDGILLGEITAEEPGVSSLVKLHHQRPITVRGRKNRLTPSIVGTPSAGLRQWGESTVSTILARTD